MNTINLDKIKKAQKLLDDSPVPKENRIYYFGTKNGMIKFETDNKGELIEESIK